MTDDPIAGRYFVPGQYRVRVQIDGPMKDPTPCGGLEPCYSVTYFKDDGRVKWHQYLDLTEESVKTRGWEKITPDNPARW